MTGANKLDEANQSGPPVIVRVDRPVRRPRVQAQVRETHEFQGRYKQHDIDLMRDGWCSNWYIRVRAPSGLYAYDGYWRDSQGKSLDDAIAEACTGACLWTPNVQGVAPAEGGSPPA
jgi:hypothetical protein